MSPGEPEEVKYTETKIAFHETKQSFVKDQLQEQNQPVLVQGLVTVRQPVRLVKLTNKDDSGRAFSLRAANAAYFCSLQRGTTDVPFPLSIWPRIILAGLAVCH